MKMNETIQLRKKSSEIISAAVSTFVVVIWVYVCSQQHCHCHGKSFSATDFPLYGLPAIWRRELVRQLHNVPWNAAWKWNRIHRIIITWSESQILESLDDGLDWACLELEMSKWNSSQAPLSLFCVCLPEPTWVNIFLKCLLFSLFWELSFSDIFHHTFFLIADLVISLEQ